MRLHSKVIVPALTAAMLLTAALTASAAAPAMPDRIERTDKAQITGIRVISAQVNVVEYEKFDGRGGVKTLRSSDIKEIHWGDAGAFRRPMAVYPKRPKAALALFLKLPKTGPRAFWYAPRLELMIGKCLYRLKKYDEALPHFQTIIKDHARSYYVLKAIEGEARCHERKRDFEQAAKAYERFDPRSNYESHVLPEPYGKMLQWRGREEMAKIFLKLDGKAGDASRIYAGLAKGTSAAIAKLPAELKAHVAEIHAIHQRALVGSVNALVKAGKADQARKMIEKISMHITDKSARVDMYVLLGGLLEKEAAKAPEEKKKSLRKKALLAYMRVYILYPGQKAQRAKCMLAAAIASHQLGSPDDNRRAVKLCDAITTDYPGSAEAKEASRLLQGLGIRR